MICSSGRMRNYLALGTVTADEVPEDMVQAVADCLRTSSFLKISDDGKKVGTKTPVAKIEEFKAERELQTKELEKNQQQRKRKCSEKAVYPERLTVKFKLLKRKVAEDKGSEKEGEEKAKEGKSIDLHPEDLIAVFDKIFTVKYMDFERGAESGYIEYEDSEASRKALAAAALNKDGLLVKNYIAILEPDFDSLAVQPRAREINPRHFLWPRRRYNEVKRMENYPTTLPILPLLKIEKYRNPLYLQDTKCVVPAHDTVFAIRWCILEFHLLVKGKINPTNHLNPSATSKLKLHLMVSVIGNQISADPDASQPPLKFINSKTQYLNGILDKEYPCLDNLKHKHDAVYRGDSFDRHLSNQNILDQEHALELMLCCHETFQMSRLLDDLRHRAPEFAIRENCPCYVTPPDDPGILQMRAEDLSTLVRDLLGPNFSPKIHTALAKKGKKLVLHEITLYVNKSRQPVVMDVESHNCKREDLVIF